MRTSANYNDSAELIRRDAENYNRKVLKEAHDMFRQQRSYLMQLNLLPEDIEKKDKGRFVVRQHKRTPEPLLEKKTSLLTGILIRIRKILSLA